jgi:predicted permease
MSIVQDLDYAARQLARRPAFTLTAVLTLAIGMGVNAVAFTVVNGLLFKAPAARQAEGLGRILTTPGGDESGNASLAEYQRFSDATRRLVDLAAEGRLAVAWRHGATTETAWVLFVSSDYFAMLDVRPVAGRIEVSRSAGGPPSVVIGERFWRQKLGAAPLAGLTLHLNGTDAAVAGVVPESFTGPAGLYSPDAWLPLADLALFNTSQALQRRDQRWLFLLGRLRPGVEVPQVQGHIDGAVAAMAREWPDTHRQRGARFKPFSEGNSELRTLGTAAAVAMGIIGLVLLLACFNVANLLLARAVERERDLAIRAAIGAGAARLIRLVVAEGVLIACLAGASALVLAAWTQSLVGTFAIPIETPQHIDLRPDRRVVGFVLLLVLVAGVLPGLWPALSASRVDPLRVLGSQAGHTAGARPSRLRGWLVRAQIAGSTAFLAIAALFVQSYGQVSEADPGFKRDELIVAEFEPAAHGRDADRAARYAEALGARVRALPGVASVALTDRAPFFLGFDRLTPVSSAASACGTGACPSYSTLAVGPGYFATMGIRLAAGREFEAERAAREAIVNQPLARILWTEEGRGVGETIHIGDHPVAVTVVGIASRAHTRGVNREQPTLYLPLDREDYEGTLSLVVRTAIPPALLVRPTIDAAQEVDPDVSLSSVKTMRERMAVQLWPFRTVSWLFSICGGLALVLATVGLAGVVIHAVSLRLREFGVRASLGATPRHLVADVLGGTARLLLPGLIAGLLLAMTAAHLARAAFVGVDVLNPLVYATVALAECAIVAAACLAPALRASRVDPLVALRSD